MRSRRNPDICTLKPLEFSHVEVLAPFANDVAVCAGLGLRSCSESWLMPWVAPDRTSSGCCAFAIFAGSGKAVGACRLVAKSLRDPTARFLVYWIARPFWGQGIGTQAVGDLLSIAFHEHGVPTVKAIVHRNNLSSIAVLRKNGFQICPTFNQRNPEARLMFARRLRELN